MNKHIKKRPCFKTGISFLRNSLILSSSGGILLWIIFMMLLISSLALGLLKFIHTSNFLELNAQFQQKAYYLAESGGRYAAPLVKSDLTNNTTTNITLLDGKTFALISDGQFMIDIDASNPDIILINSTGTVNQNSIFESQAQLTFQIDVSYLFEYGVFGDGQVTMRNNSLVDAYDSSSGSYAATQDTAAGDVASNLATADINAGATIGGNSGAPILNADKTLDPVALPACNSPCTDLGNLSLSGTLTLTGGSGDYSADDIELKNSAQLEISGDVTLIVDGNIRAKNGSSITLLSNASLTIYVSGNVTFDNGSLINDGGYPENFVIYATGTSTTITLKNSSGVFAAIYAPGADIIIDNSANVYGAVVGQTVELKNSSAIHFDKALKDANKFKTIEDPIQYYTN